MIRKEQQVVKYNVLSKYRAVLMGLAILSIIFFHFTEDCISNGYNINFITVYYKTYIGSCGVDVFLFLSGFGLYYSFKKNSDVKRFFQKRFSRVLIPYILVAFPCYFLKDVVLQKKHILYVLKDVLFVSFFDSGDRWFWYIFLISLCYLMYPYLFRYIDSSHSVGFMKDVWLVCTAIGVLFLVGNPPFFANINIALLRIPSFFAGSMIGKAACDEKEIPKGMIGLVIVSVLLLPVGKTSELLLSRYIFGLFGIVMFSCVAVVLEWMDRRGMKFSLIKRLLEWFGTYSLELYLVHVAVRKFMLYAGYPTYRVRYECVLIVLSIVVSVALKYVSGYVIQKVVLDESSRRFSNGRY